MDKPSFEGALWSDRQKEEGEHGVAVEGTAEELFDSGRSTTIDRLTSKLDGIPEPDKLEHGAERLDKDNQEEGKECDATIVRIAKESIIDEGPPDSGKSAATDRSRSEVGGVPEVEL